MLWFLVIFCFLFSYCSCQFRCGGGGPEPRNDKAKPAFYESTNCSGDQDWEFKPFEPFRLRWFFLDMPRFSAESLNVFAELLNDTIDYFEKVFLVRRRAHPILGIPSTRLCDGMDATHPTVRDDPCNASSTGGVPDADFLIYFKELDCNESNDKLAQAGSCGPNSFDGRSQFGRVKLCPFTLDTKNWNRNALRRTLQHEIFHAMGFNGGTLSSLEYTRANGSITHWNRGFRRTWKVHNNRTRTHNAQVLTSPRVQTCARDHFNCPTLEGGEIENEGGSGTEGAHWEKRIFGGETMTGYISRRSYLSEITFALFEDTLWYKTNYAFADTLDFGRGKGCEFAKGSCRDYFETLNKRDWDITGSAKPYCNWADFVENKNLGSKVRECSDDGEYYSQCRFAEKKIPNNGNLTEDIDLNKAYFTDHWAIIDGKNISGHTVFGGSATTDGCPQWTEVRMAEERGGDSVCTNKFGQPHPPYNWGAELFGDDSRCFKQDGKFEVYHCVMGVALYSTLKGGHGAGCYKYKCEKGRLMIQANYSLDDNPRYHYMRQYKVCWGAGSVIHIRRHQFSGDKGKRRFHKGDIVCPKCQDVCEGNPKYPGFKCAPDIKANSTDYSDIPCDQDISIGEAAIPELPRLQNLLMILALISLCK